MCNAYVPCKNNKTGGKSKMREGRKVNTRLLRVVERVARTKVANGLPWPPFCAGIYHQPKRPKIKLDK